MGVWLTPLDNILFFISNGIDIADLQQFGAYTDRFSMGPVLMDSLVIYYFGIASMQKRQINLFWGIK
jgi:hypothetical protein